MIPSKEEIQKLARDWGRQMADCAQSEYDYISGFEACMQIVEEDLKEIRSESIQKFIDAGPGYLALEDERNAYKKVLEYFSTWHAMAKDVLEKYK